MLISMAGTSSYADARVRRDAGPSRPCPRPPHGQAPWCAPADRPTLMERRGSPPRYVLAAARNVARPTLHRALADTDSTCPLASRPVG
jgi:hypothetical protein